MSPVGEIFAYVFCQLNSFAFAHTLLKTNKTIAAQNRDLIPFFLKKTICIRKLMRMNRRFDFTTDRITKQERKQPFAFEASIGLC